MEENQSLLSSIVTLKAELKEAKNQFEELTKSVKMLTNESKKLDDLIGQGKRYNDKWGLGSTGRKSTRNRTTVFVRECDTQNSKKNAKGKYTVDAASPVKSLNDEKFVISVESIDIFDLTAFDCKISCMLSVKAYI